MSMRKQEFTANAWEAVTSTSQQVPKKNGHEMVKTVHLMKALLYQKDGLARRVFAKAGVLSELLEATDNYIQRQLKKRKSKKPILGGGDDLEALLERARDYKEKCKDSLLSEKHLVLGFIKDERFGKQTFKNLQITEESLKSAIEEIGKTEGKTDENSEGKTDENTEGKTKALERYGEDLTAMARAGKFGQLTGIREDEIRKCIQILSKKTKNKPVLIGEPGVRKKAIVEGLAQRIVQGDVPQAFINSKLISIGTGALTFVEILKAVLKEVAESEGKIILFIDEIHTVVNGGKNDFPMDPRNDLLKSILARGELPCIGATTPREYCLYMEKDSALNGGFMKVDIHPPTVDGTILMLRGLRESYELHHGVRISDGALVEAAKLSDRYIGDKLLPDKAIDLVDEAAAKLKIEITSKPTALHEIGLSLLKLKMERLSLENDTDRASRERLNRLDAEFSILEKKQCQLSKQWEHEKSVMTSIHSIKKKIDSIHLKTQQAKRKCDELEYGTLNSLQRQLISAKQKLDEYKRSGKSMLREKVVTGHDISEIISKSTGIPVSKLQQSERERLLQLEEELHKHVVGQDRAVKSVAEAIQRSRVGLSDPDRPIASFMFMGPTGVGKTELAKALARCIFNTEEALVRIDMSEYQCISTYTKLLGAPPGYVGYNDGGGQLTEAIRRRPYSVILFDEIEKADHDLLNVFLQILDDGRLTDSHGRTVSFTNTIIIMTSNVGSQTEDHDDCTLDYEAIKQRAIKAAKSRFKPEFINRVDEYIVFHPFDSEQINNIVKIQLERLKKRIFVENKMKIRVSHAAERLIGILGNSKTYGARPVKRVIQQCVETEIAKGILRGEFTEEDTILVDREFSDGMMPLQKLVFKSSCTSIVD